MIFTTWYCTLSSVQKRSTVFKKQDSARDLYKPVIKINTSGWLIKRVPRFLCRTKSLCWNAQTPSKQIQSHFRHSQSHLCHCPGTAVSALGSARLNTRKLYKNVFTLSMDKPFCLLFPARTSFSLREEGVDGKPGQLSRGVVYKRVSKRTLASGKRHEHLK